MTGVQTVLFRSFFWFEIYTKENQVELVDFEKSIFYKVKGYSLRNKIEQIKMDSFDDYKVKDKILNDQYGITHSILSEKIVLKRKAMLDIFKIGVFDTKFYVSPILYQKLLDEKITGCKIEEAIVVDEIS